MHLLINYFCGEKILAEGREHTVIITHRPFRCNRSRDTYPPRKNVTIHSPTKKKTWPFSSFVFSFIKGVCSHFPAAPPKSTATLSHILFTPENVRKKKYLLERQSSTLRLHLKKHSYCFHEFINFYFKLICIFFFKKIINSLNKILNS